MCLACRVPAVRNMAGLGGLRRDFGWPELALQTASLTDE